MTDRPGLDFSFSGLKTYTLNTWKTSNQSDTARCDIARAFEDAVVDTLAIKCRRALRSNGARDLVIAGGVGANQRLRERLLAIAAEENARLYYPRNEFCTDNGAMIAYAGYVRLAAGHTAPLEIEARARWPLDSVESL